MIDRARADVYGDETRLWSLLRFAEEEVKHQEMLRRAVDQFEAGFRVTCGLVPGREEVAEVVLDASPLTALLLTSMIEWFTQLHYTEHVQDRAELDELFRDILRFHWIDESRHARMDSLLIDEIAGELTTDDREQAIDQLLELGGAVDGLLGQQIELDSTRCSGPAAVPSPTTSATRSAPTSGAPTAGPSSSPGSNTPTSSGSSSSSRPPAPPGSQPPRGHSPPDSTPSVGNHVYSKGGQRCPFGTDPRSSLA